EARLPMRHLQKLAFRLPILMRTSFKRVCLKSNEEMFQPTRGDKDAYGFQSVRSDAHNQRSGQHYVEGRVDQAEARRGAQPVDARDGDRVSIPGTLQTAGRKPFH